MTKITWTTGAEIDAALAASVAEAERVLRDPANWRVSTEAETVAAICDGVAEFERMFAAWLASF